MSCLKTITSPLRDQSGARRLTLRTRNIVGAGKPGQPSYPSHRRSGSTWRGAARRHPAARENLVRCGGKMTCARRQPDCTHASARTYCYRAKADNTRAASRSAVRAWYGWCARHDLTPPQASPPNVAAFMAAGRYRGLAAMNARSTAAGDPLPASRPGPSLAYRRRPRGGDAGGPMQFSSQIIESRLLQPGSGVGNCLESRSQYFGFSTRHADLWHR